MNNTDFESKLRRSENAERDFELQILIPRGFVSIKAQTDRYQHGANKEVMTDRYSYQKELNIRMLPEIKEKYPMFIYGVDWGGYTGMNLINRNSYLEDSKAFDARVLMVWRNLPLRGLEAAYYKTVGNTDGLKKYIEMVYSEYGETDFYGEFLDILEPHGKRLHTSDDKDIIVYPLSKMSLIESVLDGHLKQIKLENMQYGEEQLKDQSEKIRKLKPVIKRLDDFANKGRILWTN